MLIIPMAPASAQERAPLRSFALRANSPKFWDLLDHDAKLTTVATGFGFTEGPVWDEHGYLWVSDETLNKIFRVYADGRK
jgi:gluconolactonase